MSDVLKEKARELDRVKRAEARGETNPRRTHEDVRAEYEIERRQEKMRELRARIRELEAENAMNLEAAQALEVERHKERERAEKAEAENARLREAGNDLELTGNEVAQVAHDSGVGLLEVQAFGDVCLKWDAAKRGTHG